MTRANEYAVILLDLMMPTMNGIQFLEAFHQMTPRSRTVIFVMTAGDDSALRRLPANLVHGIVRKPFDVPQLVSMVREVALTRFTPTQEAPERRAEALPAEIADEPQQTDPTN